jgi:exopolysaccharide production protein ExoQ
LNKFESVGLNPAGVLSLIFFLMPAIGAISSKAMVPLILAGLLIFIGAHMLRGIPKLKPPLILTAGLSVLVLWSTLSLIWAPLSRPNDWLILSLAGILIAGLVFLGWVPVLNKDERRRAEIWFLAGYGVANLIFLFEAITSSWISRQVRGLEWIDIIGIDTVGQNLEAFLSNGVVILVLLTWPAIIVLNRRKKWRWSIVALISVSGIAVHIGHSASLLAIFAGLFAWGIARFSRNFAAKSIAATFIILVVSMPFLVGGILDPAGIRHFANSNIGRKMPSSVVPRLTIWEFAAKRSMERPVLGWGLNSSRIMPGGGDKVIILDDGKGKISEKQIYYNESKLPLHPHNQALQVWLELGGVAAIFAALFGGAIIFRLSRASIAEAPVFGLITSYLTFALSSFGAWQNWWIATLFLIAIIWRSVCHDPDPAPRSA